MIDQKQIEEWLKNGTITNEQASKMLTDSVNTKNEEGSNKFITAISSIGAVLFGVGAILFVALNWSSISYLFKVIILLGSTFGSYFVGYLFAYKNENYPRVGHALIFLGALLFGASVFLIAQIYNLNSSVESTYMLLFTWLIGILPLVYSFLSKPIASLASLLFIVFIYLFVSTEMNRVGQGFEFFGDGYERFFLDMLIIIVISGIMLFGLGGLHYAKDKLKGIARVYRLFGLQISLLITFLLSMNFVYSIFDRSTTSIPSSVASNWVIMFGTIALLLSLANIFLNFAKNKLFVVENGINIGLLVLVLFTFFFIGPTSSQAFHVIFNIVFVVIIIAILYIGYQNMDITVVNKGLAYASLFIGVKYFEWFWDTFNPYLFFMVGGLILILGGIALEKKRRQIRTKFAISNIVLNNA